MQRILTACSERVSETIFLTPNMLNTYVAETVSEEYRDYAKVTAEYQNSGRMDQYMQKAREVAEKIGVSVCDCYSIWKTMYENGTDTTKLLVNGINHPIREMHTLFADELFKILFSDFSKEENVESTMFRKKTKRK